MGAEYLDTWAQSPDRRECPEKLVREEEEEEEEPGPSDTGEQGESSWISADKDPEQKYETVLHLDGMSRREMGDGVREAIKNHDNLKSTSTNQR